MEHDEKTLKIATKVTASIVSESGKLDFENAKKVKAFFVSFYKKLVSEGELLSPVSKAAGKITAAAFEESKEFDSDSAVEFFKILYDELFPLAINDNFDEDVFKSATKITASACAEIESFDKDTALEAAGFFRTIYFGFIEDTAPCKGKYIVKKSEKGYSFSLASANNQVIGVSELYSSKAAMEKGIESVRKNAPDANLEDQTDDEHETVSNPKFEIYKDKAGEFRFRLKAKNGEIILVSEGYKSKASCEKGIESVRKNSPAEIKE